MREKLHRSSADLQTEYHSQKLDSFYCSRTPFLEDLKVGKFATWTYNCNSLHFLNLYYLLR